MKLILFSGHMLDRPDRVTARFPAEKASWVQMAIESQLNAWRVDAADQVICSAACGSDLLFAEACLKRRIKPQIYLPFSKAQFSQSSVAWAGFAWETRFNKVCDQAELRVMESSQLDRQESSESAFVENNLWMIEEAEADARKLNAKVHVLLVWDGQQDDENPGGTTHFAHQVEKLSWPSHVIDPSRLIG